MKRAKILVVSLVLALSMALVLGGCATQDFTPEKRDPQVSDNALKEPGKLRVGVDASKAPYAAESSAEIVGINVDIAAALASEMGLTLEVVDVGSDVNAAFTNENVDVVMGVGSDDKDHWLSDKYLTAAVTLFSKEEGKAAPTQNDVFSVAAQSSSMSAWEVETIYGQSHLQSMSDLPSSFSALQDGSVTFAAADSVIGQYVAHSTGTQVYPVVLLQNPTEYHVAVAKDNTELQESLTSAMQSINNGGMVNVIMKKWLGSPIDVSGLSVATPFPASSTDTAAQ